MTQQEYEVISQQCVMNGGRFMLSPQLLFSLRIPGSTIIFPTVLFIIYIEFAKRPTPNAKLKQKREKT